MDIHLKSDYQHNTQLRAAEHELTLKPSQI